MHFIFMLPISSYKLYRVSVPNSLKVGQALPPEEATAITDFFPDWEPLYTQKQTPHGVVTILPTWV